MDCVKDDRIINGVGLEMTADRDKRMDLTKDKKSKSASSWINGRR